MKNEQRYPLNPDELLQWNPHYLEKKARVRFIDESIRRAQFGKIQVHYEGSLIRFGCLPGWQPHENYANAKRGMIGGFSAKSRGRMMELCAKIRADASALFVTLTYPTEWPDAVQKWKRDLDAFGKWLVRSYAGASAVWKLEPQQRGAPHFHLLVWGAPFIAHIHLARRWFEIVGSKDPKHLAAGTSIERVRSARGVRRYASKNYMGKECVMPPGWEHVGRFWGVIGRKNLPLSDCNELIFPRAAMIKIRRVVRRYLHSKGFRRGAKSSVRLYTEAHAQWLRVMLWANDVWFPSLATILTKSAKRSAENCSPRLPGEGRG